MNNRKLRLVFALLLCCVLVLTATMPSTLAYIADRSKTVRNNFRVEYLPAQDVTVPVRVKKNVDCVGKKTIGPEGFSFRLENITTGSAVMLTSGRDGWAETALTFTAEDAGKTYSYRLYEINDGREHVVYDERVYEFTIALQLDELHELTCLFTVDGEPAEELAMEFLNLYNVIEIPETGDAAQPLLWLTLMIFSGAGLVLLCNRRAVARRN